MSLTRSKKEMLNEEEDSRQDFRVYPDRGSVVRCINMHALDEGVPHFSLDKLSKDSLTTSKHTVFSLPEHKMLRVSFCDLPPCISRPSLHMFRSFWAYHGPMCVVCGHPSMHSLLNISCSLKLLTQF